MEEETNCNGCIGVELRKPLCNQMVCFVLQFHIKVLRAGCSVCLQSLYARQGLHSCINLCNQLNLNQCPLPTSPFGRLYLELIQVNTHTLPKQKAHTDKNERKTPLKTINKWNEIQNKFRKFICQNVRSCKPTVNFKYQERCWIIEKNTQQKKRKGRVNPVFSFVCFCSVFILYFATTHC